MDGFWILQNAFSLFCEWFACGVVSSCAPRLAASTIVKYSIYDPNSFLSNGNGSEIEEFTQKLGVPFRQKTVAHFFIHFFFRTSPAP
jgi:hypothetical protein